MAGKTFLSIFSSFFTGTHNDTVHWIFGPYIRIIFSLLNGKRRTKY